MPKETNDDKRKQAAALWWKKWHEQEDTFINAERKWQQND